MVGFPYEMLLCYTKTRLSYVNRASFPDETHHFAPMIRGSPVVTDDSGSYITRGHNSNSQARGEPFRVELPAALEL